MDYATYRELLSKRTALPMLEIGRNHPLADPERPQYVDGRDSAQSLFLHLEHEMTKADPLHNPMWFSLLASATSIRTQQLAEARPATVIVEHEAIGTEALSFLVEAVQARTNLRQILTTAFAGLQRDQAIRLAETTVLRRALDRDGNAEVPAGHQGLPGFAEIWSGPEARNYRASVHRLALAAKSEAKVRNLEISEQNDLNEPNEQIPPVEASDILKNWLNSMNQNDVGNETLWTKDYAVIMDSEEEALVAKKFLDIALKAIEDKKTPSLEEIKTTVQAIRDELAVPAYRLQTAMADYRIQNKEADEDRAANNYTPIMKPETIAMVVREAITDRSREFARGASFGTNHEIDGAQVIARLAEATPIVGLEGQKYYQNVEAIADRLKSLIPEDGKNFPMVISHAEDGSPFRAALLEAAAQAQISVVNAKINLNATTRKIFSDVLREHNNITFTAEALVMTDRKSTCMIEGQDFKTRETQQFALTSSAGRYAARGRLVLVNIEGGDEKQRFNAMVNHAALTPNQLIAFGHERNDSALARIVMRREMQDRADPTVIDKTGKEITYIEVRQKFLDNNGAVTPHMRKAAHAFLDSKGLKTSSAAGQYIVTEAIGAKRAEAVLASFDTLNDAYEAARRAQQAPKEARAWAAEHGLSDEALRGAAALLKEQRDTERFSRIVTRSQAMIEMADRANSAILANPADPIVAKYGPLAGFSALRNDDGSQIRSVPTVAIIGDAKPISENLATNIDRAVENLVSAYGKHPEGGKAKVRILTTLTPGIGEAVMEAALKHGVPVEAINHADDRKITSHHSAEMRLFKLAAEIEKAELGGTWTLAKYNEPHRTYTPTAAARAAIDGADAVLVARLDRENPITIAVAAAGQTKPTFVMNASDPQPRAYSGNKALISQDTTLSLVLDANDKDNAPRILENAVYRANGQSGFQASVDTKAGAFKVSSNEDFAKIAEATQGKLDASLGRERPLNQLDAATQNRVGVRLELLDSVNLDEFGSNAKYRESLGLTKPEIAMIDNARMSKAMQPDTALHLSTRFAVTEQRSRRHREAEGREI